MLLAEPEKFAEIMKSGQLEKASKVSYHHSSSEIYIGCAPNSYLLQMRLWCIQVPMPNIPTIVATAMPISAKFTADDLFLHLKTLLDGLISRGLLDAILYPDWTRPA